MLSSSELRQIALARIALPFVVYGDEEAFRVAMSEVPHIEIQMSEIARAGIAEITVLTGLDDFIAVLEDSDMLPSARERTIASILLPIVHSGRTVFIQRSKTASPLPLAIRRRVVHLDVEPIIEGEIIQASAA